MTRIGILGGTFDPIHYGHLILAQQALEELALEKVLFITAANPPHKASELISNENDRLDMTKLAISDNNHFEFSDIEIKRQGISYTIDTLTQLKEIYGDSSCIYLLIGADEAKIFTKWRKTQEIVEIANVVVANRPGYNVDEAISSLPDAIAQKITPLQIPGIDISSTDLRERVYRGNSIKYLVHSKVEEYIIMKGLYTKQ